jgi:hypothetical protein
VDRTKGGSRAALKQETNRLGHGNFLPGLKLSGGRDGGLGLACGAVLGRLSVGQPWAQMAFCGSQLRQVLRVWA